MPVATLAPQQPTQCDNQKCLQALPNVFWGQNPQKVTHINLFSLPFCCLLCSYSSTECFSQNPQVKLATDWFNGLIIVQNYSYIPLQISLSSELLPRGIIIKFPNIMEPYRYKSMQHKAHMWEMTAINKASYQK